MKKPGTDSLTQRAGCTGRLNFIWRERESGTAPESLLLPSRPNLLAPEFRRIS